MAEQLFGMYNIRVYLIVFELRMMKKKERKKRQGREGGANKQMSGQKKERMQVKVTEEPTVPIGLERKRDADVIKLLGTKEKSST